jgi:probable rRNA maturation factor
VISLPRVEHQASVYGHSFEVEMLFLVSHGVLHLLGYEHDKEDDMLVMQSKQKDILHSMGYDLNELGDMAVRIAESTNGDERQVIRA